MLASSGLATPPCGVPRVFRLPPLMRRVSFASRSSIGALSHILMRRRTFRSTTRRATDLINSECGIVSKYLDKSAPKLAVEDLPAERPIFGRLFAIVRAALASLRRGMLTYH